MVKGINIESKTRIIIRCEDILLMDVISNKGIYGCIDTDEIKSIRKYKDIYNDTTILEVEVYKYEKVQRHKLS